MPGTTPLHVEAFEQLESPIHDIERMASIAFYKVRQIDDASAERDMATFAVAQLRDMVMNLRREYERLCHAG